jgi:hypothetical protein
MHDFENIKEIGLQYKTNEHPSIPKPKTLIIVTFTKTF